jgi:hypothetical protein
MSTANIFVVIGSTGEYSDHREWLVRAYASEERAKEAVTHLTQRANEWIQKRESKYDGGPPEGWCELDPNMMIDYSGSTYTFETVELEP